MNNNQRIYRNGLLAKIHMHPKYKEIKAADIWEDYLYVRFKVTSSVNLGIEELKGLLDCLNGKDGKDDKLNIKDRIMLFGSKQDRKIILLAEDLGMMENLSEFIYRQTKLNSLEECSKEEKTKIIIGLEKIKRERR